MLRNIAQHCCGLLRNKRNKGGDLGFQRGQSDEQFGALMVGVLLAAGAVVTVVGGATGSDHGLTSPLLRWNHGNRGHHK